MFLDFPFIFLSILCLAPSDASKHVFASHETSTSQGPPERIYNGSLANYTEYPYFARTLTNNQRVCSASMIEHDWVLTAAHCLLSGVKYVFLGPGVEAGFGGGKTDASADYFVPSQSEYTKEPYEYDFALVKLGYHDQQIASSLSLPPPGLDLTYIDTSEQVTILAGGSTISINNAPVNDTNWVMKTVDTSVTLVKCAYTGNLRPTFLFEVCERTFPAFPADGSRICPGDSGGPLIIKSHGRHHLIALVFFGWHHCSSGYDHDSFKGRTGAIFVRIAPHMPFILHKIDAHSQSHNQRELMDQWMVHPDLLPSKFSLL